MKTKSERKYSKYQQMMKETPLIRLNVERERYSQVPGV